MTREEILDKAKECVCGHREREYGTPENNFQAIANLWTAYKLIPFTPVDVAMMMALLKIARIQSGTSTDDSFVDLAGYAACGGEIAASKREPEQDPYPDEFKFSKFTVSCEEEFDSICKTMSDTIEKYGAVSVSDLYDIIGLDSPNLHVKTHQNYGWLSLKGIKLDRNSDGTMTITMPNAIRLAEEW